MEQSSVKNVIVLKPTKFKNLFHYVGHGDKRYERWMQTNIVKMFNSFPYLSLLFKMGKPTYNSRHFCRDTCTCIYMWVPSLPDVGLKFGDHRGAKFNIGGGGGGGGRREEGKVGQRQLLG